MSIFKRKAKTEIKSQKLESLKRYCQYCGRRLPCRNSICVLATRTDKLAERAGLYK